MKRALLVLAIGLFLVSFCHARIVTLQVDGIINEAVSDESFTFDGNIPVGSSMTGFLTYDTDTPVLNPTQYFPTSYELIAISMTIGDYTFTHDPTADKVSTFDDIPTFRVADGYYIAAADYIRFDGSTMNGKTCDEFDWTYTYMRMLHISSSDPTVITSTELPDPFPDFSLFDGGNDFYITCNEAYPSTNYFGIYGEITNVFEVPEPGTMCLVALGGVLLRRRR